MTEFIEGAVYWNGNKKEYCYRLTEHLGGRLYYHYCHVKDYKGIYNTIWKAGGTLRWVSDNWELYEAPVTDYRKMTCRQISAFLMGMDDV